MGFSKLQLTLHYCQTKSINSLNSGFIPGLIPVISKVTQRKYSNFCRNKLCILAISRQFYFQTNSFSAKKRQSFISSLPSRFNAKSLWDMEENEQTSAEHKTDDKLESSHTKKNHLRQDKILFNKLKEGSCKDQEIKNEDWDSIRMSILEIPGTINEENIDAITMNSCAEISLSLCKSYFKYLKATNKRINRATYGNYLRAFHTFSSSCTDNDLNEILDVYNELVSVYPILDCHTAEKVVFAISLTKNWKNYDKLFRDIKQFYHPSGPVYSVVIRTAFRNGEIDLGWKLIEEMMVNCGRVSDDVFKCWLEANKTNEDLVRVLNFLNKFNTMPSSQLSETIMMTFNDINAQGKGTFTTILKSGICTRCNSKLERAWVSTVDYDQLKSAFLNPVLIGKDIFLKTQPEEFNEFLQFLKRTAPYDIVLDGLNIALKMHKSKKTPKALASQLKSVVRHFAAENKKILVIGRKHMRKWPVEELNYIEDNAHVFLAEDMSQDDPFLLYATLYSGVGTCFVSRDMMRGHKFLLCDPKLQDTFQKWQALHQYFIMYIEDNGAVNIKAPVPFMQTIQRNSLGDWHIPYEVKEELTFKSCIDNYHKHWLCLTNCAIEKTERGKEHEFSRGYTSQNRKIWEDRPIRRELPRSKFRK